MPSNLFVPVMQPFTSCKLGCASNGDLHCTCLLLFLVKEVPSLMLYPWRMVRDTTGIPLCQKASYLQEGGGLQSSLPEKNVCLWCFQQLEIASTSLQTWWKDWWIWRKAVSNFQIYLECDILGQWFFVSEWFFQSCREETATDLAYGGPNLLQKGPFS